MSRQLFAAENGLRILGLDSFNGVDIITGSALPGSLDQEIIAAVGSIYLRSNGDLYQKITSGSGADKWKRKLDTSDLLTMSPRSEKIIVGTADVAPSFPATMNLAATHFGDDDVPYVMGADFAIGTHILYGVGGTPVLAVVSNVVGDVLTINAAANPLHDNDYMIVQKYLINTPDAMENQALVHYVGGAIIKVSDMNWNFANGIGLAAGYAAASGNVTASDTVQSAIAKLDGVNDAQDSALGIAQGVTHLGTFTGTTIPDSSSVKGAAQALETSLEHVNTLTGVAHGADHLGTFTGTTIPDDVAIKPALQALESKVESLSFDKKTY